MTLKLYMNKSPYKQVKKDITLVSTVETVQPYDNIDLLKPNFVLSYDDSLLTVNYCYIEKLSRYYFCKVSVNNEKRLYIECNVDVLMSFPDDIYNADCVVTRSESIGKPTAIADNQYPVNPNNFKITSVMFPEQPFSETPVRPFVLTTLGR